MRNISISRLRIIFIAIVHDWKANTRLMKLLLLSFLFASICYQSEYLFNETKHLCKQRFIHSHTDNFDCKSICITASVSSRLWLDLFRPLRGGFQRKSAEALLELADVQKAALKVKRQRITIKTWVPIKAFNWRSDKSFWKLQGTFLHWKHNDHSKSR